MGKIIYFISAIVFIWILAIVTGQINLDTTDSITSVFINAILDFGEFSFTQLVGNVLGDLKDYVSSRAGILSLAASAGVAIGAYLSTSSDQRMYIPVAFTFSLLTTDIITIFNNFGLNPVLRAFIMIPIGIIYVIVIVDWLRGRD